jgi:anthranilate phosphoribosyltransferase
MFVGGHASSIREGIARAAAALDSGSVRRTLERMAVVSHEGKQA